MTTAPQPAPESTQLSLPRPGESKSRRKPRGASKKRREPEQRPVYLLNPIGFDPADHLPEGLRRHGDCARHLVHSVICGHAFRRDAEYVPLMAAILRRYFPSNPIYTVVRQCLIDGGVIAYDGRYIIGEKSYGYDLGPEYRESRLRWHAVEDRMLARKIRDRRGDRINAPESVHKHLLKNLRRVEIDYPAALEAVLARGYKQANEAAIELLRRRQYYFHVCDYGRVHTNLTNLSRSLRPFLSFRGMPLVNLDIRNSQPLFFAVVLKARYAGKRMPADVERYIELVQAGEIYDYLMAGAGNPAGERSEFKRTLFAEVFFGKNRPVTDADEAAKAFRDLFPSVHAVIREEKAGDHAALAHKLQRAESGLMIDRVAVRIAREMPEAFVGTIHDSILTTPDVVEQMREIMVAGFAEQDLHPTINVENLQAGR